MLQESGGRDKSCSNGVDGGYRRLAGKVLEGEEGTKAACEGLGFAGEGFAEGQDGGVCRGGWTCGRHCRACPSGRAAGDWDECYLVMGILPESQRFRPWQKVPRDNDFVISAGCGYLRHQEVSRGMRTYKYAGVYLSFIINPLGFQMAVAQTATPSGTTTREFAALLRKYCTLQYLRVLFMLLVTTRIYTYTRIYILE